MTNKDRNIFTYSFSEHFGYDFKHPNYDMTCGHFMQLVWVPTIKFGVGIAFAHDQTWIVARYTPAEDYNYVDPITDHIHFPAGRCYDNFFSLRVSSGPDLL